MKARHIAVFPGVVTAASWALVSAPVPSASAQPCPDVEVVFARGTAEDPGVGPTGQAFVDSLRTRVAPKSMGVYPVNYPATTDFPTAVDGIYDASAHIKSVVANCPKTEMVLGGFSQGAAVMGFTTDNVIPDGISASDVPSPMPPDVANHVAAVALFGKPNSRFMRVINQPPVAVGPLYAGKTIDLCIPDDIICSNAGSDFNAHTQYQETGMVDQAATFTAGHVLAAAPAPAATPQSPAPAATPPAPAPAATPPAPAPAATPPAPAPAAPPAPAPAAPPQAPAPPPRVPPGWTTLAQLWGYS